MQSKDTPGLPAPNADLPDPVLEPILKSGIAVDVLQVLNSLALLVQQYAN
jgi:hypothetical protein